MMEPQATGDAARRVGGFVMPPVRVWPRLALALLLGPLALAQVGAAVAQDATPAATAGRLLIGTWQVTDTTSASSVVITFTGDGLVVATQNGGTGYGAWDATGPATATFTLVGPAAAAPGPAA